MLPHDDPLVISAVIAKHPIERILVDNGSSVNLIYWNCFQKMNLTTDRLREVGTPLYSFSGEAVSVIGSVQLPVTLGGERTVTRMATFMVVKSISTAYNVILGRPLLNDMRAVISPAYLLMKFPTPQGVGQVRGDQKKARACYVSSIKGKDTCYRISTMVVKDGAEEVAVESKPEPVERLESVRMKEFDEEKLVFIGSQLAPHAKEEIVKCLRDNADIFAWSPADMPGIDPEVISHRLNVDPSRIPIKQKKRNIAPDRQKAVDEEVNKLLKAGFIREVYYPDWLANVVMVKKANGQWRMCVDFTDLNKACPKDSYPLPRIDKLVDETSGYELLSFMDAFAGYHQIMMHPKDEEKTAFITENGTYCYKVMPFGLKNAGATYQRMVNMVFKELIGNIMEAYVDDMIVKSKKGESHAGHLSTVFSILRKYNMRLNPTKCSFGVQSGKFLGYMITQRGIEANPKKVQAILDMKSPSSVKEVQQLTGRLAALNRFLSKSAEKSLPFFKTLGARRKFEWTKECEEAFGDLKKYLREMPLLTRPQAGEQLYMYLGVSEAATSAVLLRKDGVIDKPIYYVSRVLRGAEPRYSRTEKMALALVMASRKLRPYFQAHTIKVLTDQPLRQILQKPDYSGRLTKWAIELSQFDIHFEPRQAIKGQALADFIVECTFGAPEEETKASQWTLFVDGASSSQGSGAGVVLISPHGDVLEYSLRFSFPSSNNIAEYEALIAGMRLALQLHAERLVAHSDSQLVVQQFHGEYEAREPVMVQYLQKVRGLAGRFSAFELVQINRSANNHADALSKLASSRDSSARTVKVEILSRPTIEEEEVLTIADNQNDWRIPIRKYLELGELPSNHTEAKKIKVRGARFVLINGILYKRAFARPLLKCLGPEEIELALAETHEGICGQHLGSRALASKILRAGFFWPTMKEDALNKVRKCDSCQRHAPVVSAPISELQSVIEPTPFAKWGLDILGPFPQATGGRKFLIVATDYFTKWIEAEPLATITSKRIEEMVWKDIICRFGLPRVLVADHGKQFDCEAFKGFCGRLHIRLSLASVSYPQANGQAESSNRTILNGLKAKLEGAKGAWVEQLPSVLWAYRTTSRVSTGETPFNLVYGTDALIPVEIGFGSTRTVDFTTEQENLNSDALRENLDLLDEQREQACIRLEAYHRRVAGYYNARVKTRPMGQGDLVLRKSAITNALREEGKLRANWEGPYRISSMLGPHTATLETLGGKKMPKTWNTNHLKFYFPSDV